MLAHAGQAIRRAFQKWNNTRQWNFTKSTTTVSLVAPFTVANVTLTTGDNEITSVSAFTNVLEGDLVSGLTSGLPSETYVVTKTDSSALVLSCAPTSPTSPATLTFSRRDYVLPLLAGATKYIYDVRLVSSNKLLYPLTTRLGDRVNPNQGTPAEPDWYDDFAFGEKGVIRFLPTPHAAGTVVIKQNRRLAMPVTDGTAIDIPEDFELSLLDLAKGYFCLDKTNAGRIADEYLALGLAGLKEAIVADTKRPDTDTAFLPSSYNIGTLDTTTLSYALIMDDNGDV